MPAHPKKGDVVIHLDLDPYERSFHHVSTHLFLKELTEPAVREALEAVARTWPSSGSPMARLQFSGRSRRPHV